MPLDELLINTGVDALIKLVRAKGRVELSDAAKELGISYGALEEWGRALEEEGILKIEYKFTKVYLIWVTSTDAQLAQKKEDIVDKKVELTRDLESVVERIGGRERELDNLQAEFAKIVVVFDTKMKDIKLRLDELKAVEKDKDEIIKRHTEEKERIKKDVVALEQSLRASENKIPDVKGTIATISTQLEKIDKDIPKFKDFGEQSKKVIAEASAALKLINEQQSQYKALKELQATFANRIEQYESTIKKIDEELGKAKEKLGEIDKGESIDKMKTQLNVEIAEVKGFTEKFDNLLSKRAETEDFLKRMHEEARKLEQQASILLKEVDMLRMEGGEKSLEEVKSKAEEIKSKVDVVKSEEKKFEEKREELRGMLRKLLEESDEGKPKHK